jgi:septum formation topological specificity factor MinE
MRVNMSSEYKDWYNDVLTALNAKMWEADFLPDGWTNTFIPEMKKELANVLGSYVDDFVIFQIKEKYGYMRMYWSWADRDYTDNEAKDVGMLTTDIEAIIRKYENISEKTCVVCGKESTKMTAGWVMPVCDEHEYL